MGSYGRKPAVLILVQVILGDKLLDEKFWKNSWANSSITSSHWFFFSSWNRFSAELWLGKKVSFTEESDGGTADVLILLAAPENLLHYFKKLNKSGNAGALLMKTTLACQSGRCGGQMCSSRSGTLSNYLNIFFFFRWESAEWMASISRRLSLISVRISWRNSNNSKRWWAEYSN